MTWFTLALFVLAAVVFVGIRRACKDEAHKQCVSPFSQCLDCDDKNICARYHEHQQDLDRDRERKCRIRNPTRTPRTTLRKR